MPDPSMPPWLQQGLGWSPAADPSMPADVPAPPGPDQWGGLPPSVVQGMGWAPPSGDQPLEAPTLPPTPQQLPSTGGQLTSAPGPGGAPDFQVPPSAFGGGAGAPPAGRPTGSQSAPRATGAPIAAKPLAASSFDQQMANLQQREQGTEQQHLAAVDANTAANQLTHAEQLKEYSKANATLAASAAADKAEQDRYKSVYEKNQAQMNADRAAVDNHKFNANKFMDEMGVGDHIRWGIGQILAGVGQGMMRQGGPNPVTQMLQQKIHDANVQQQNERDALVQKLGFDKETGLDAAAFHATRNADIAKRDSVALTGLAKGLDEAALRAADPMDKARGLKEAADVRGMSDERAKAWVQLKSQHDHQQAELGIQRQQVGIAGGHLAIARQAEQRAQKLQDLEYGPGGFKEQALGLQAAEIERKALKDQKEKVSSQGLFNPTTGAALLTAKGKTLMAQADQVEATARKDPTQAAAAYVDSLRSQAKTPQSQALVQRLDAQVKSDPSFAQQVAVSYVDNLRQTAKTTEVATIDDKEDRRHALDTIDFGNRLYKALDDVKTFLANDPGITDRKGWGQVQAAYGSAMGDMAKYLDANASSREFDAISDHILKFNPDSIVDRMTQKTPAVGAIEKLQSIIKQGVDSKLKSRGVTDGWTPSSEREQPAESFGGKTAKEVGEEAKPGLADQYLFDPVTHPIDTARGLRTPEVLSSAAEESALGRIARVGKTIQTSDYGLDPADEYKAHAAIRRADTAGNDERTRIIDSIAAPIVSAKRPSLAAGLLNLVRDQDPQMYQEILAKLPTDDVKAIQRVESTRSSVMGNDTKRPTARSGPSE